MNSTDVGIPQNTMVLGKHSGKHALREKLESMGYELSDEELESVFTRFKDLAVLIHFNGCDLRRFCIFFHIIISSHFKPDVLLPFQHKGDRSAFGEKFHL